jgi:hypothetical protein
MEVDGMYENTPWERIALYAPWIGLAVLTLALLYFIIGRVRARGNDGEDNLYFAQASDAIARHLAALGAAMLSLGILFVKFWRAAHDTYPTGFGDAAIRLIVVALAIGVVLTLLWRRFLWVHATYAMLTAAAAAAAAVSAFSHTIIAEGQVTAMVLPLGYVMCAVLAAIVSGVAFQMGMRNLDLYDLLNLVVFLGGVWFMSQKLPVVQFHADSSLYPVTGSMFVVAAGRLARLGGLPRWAPYPIALAAIGLGYLLGYWYGVAIAAVGFSISGALDRLPLPSEESHLPRSTAA